MPEVLRLPSADATESLLREIRALLERAFPGDFSAADWEHARGGWHVLATTTAGAVLAHAAVVPRVLEVAARPWSTGYVEAVGTEPERQGQGLGSLVMAEAEALIRSEFDLGGLATGSHGFYEPRGWERWQGPTFVRRDDGEALVRSPDDDDGIMVLRFGPSAAVDLTQPISCAARAGDDW